MAKTSNCLFFAVQLWLNRGMRGYVATRKSNWGNFPHFLYAEKQKSGKLRMVSYKPTNPTPQGIPPLLFKGMVKWGDIK